MEPVALTLDDTVGDSAADCETLGVDVSHNDGFADADTLGLRRADGDVDDDAVVLTEPESTVDAVDDGSALALAVPSALSVTVADALGVALLHAVVDGTADVDAAAVEESPREAVENSDGEVEGVVVTDADTEDTPLAVALARLDDDGVGDVALDNVAIGDADDVPVPVGQPDGKEEVVDVGDGTADCEPVAVRSNDELTDADAVVALLADTVKVVMPLRVDDGLAVEHTVAVTLTVTSVESVGVAVLEAENVEVTVPEREGRALSVFATVLDVLADVDGLDDSRVLADGVPVRAELALTKAVADTDPLDTDVAVPAKLAVATLEDVPQAEADVVADADPAEVNEPTEDFD